MCGYPILLMRRPSVFWLDKKISKRLFICPLLNERADEQATSLLWRQASNIERQTYLKVTIMFAAEIPKCRSNRVIIYTVCLYPLTSTRM